MIQKWEGTYIGASINKWGKEEKKEKQDTQRKKEGKKEKEKKDGRQ